MQLFRWNLLGDMSSESYNGSKQLMDHGSWLGLSLKHQCAPARLRFGMFNLGPPNNSGGVRTYSPHPFSGQDHPHLRIGGAYLLPTWDLYRLSDSCWKLAVD